MSAAMERSVITLLTDFGFEDPYVGIMKGVIQRRLPGAVCVDLTHAIPPQNLLRAAYCLEFSYRYFPRGTVHCCVVDPGVGGDRAILAVSFDGYIFLAPDNGVLTRVLSKGGARKMVRVENSDFFLKPVSSTFHGRDIFAPVAAALASGTVLDLLGPETGHMEKLPVTGPRLLGKGEIEGEFVFRDRFGNLITNIPSSMLPEDPRIFIGTRVVRGIVSRYSEVEKGELLGVIGSTGCLEIAVNGGDAAVFLGVGEGDRIRVCPAVE